MGDIMVSSSRQSPSGKWVRVCAGGLQGGRVIRLTIAHKDVCCLCVEHVRNTCVHVFASAAGLY